MSEPLSVVARQESGPHSTPVATSAGQSHYLQPEQVIIDLSVASRKRLFEVFSKLIVAGLLQQIDSQHDKSDISLSEEDIFDTLHDRERLGCTALGEGIALPHGRLAGIQEPIIAIAKLQSPINYDAPDGEPVWLAVCLLVPTEANELHLQLLATLASRFSDEKFVQEVRAANSSGDLYNLFSDL